MERLIFIFSLTIFFSCGSNRNSGDNIKPVNDVPQISYSVIRSFPHDSSSFTEGFLFYQSLLFESTGSPDNLPQTKSLLGMVDMKTGRIAKRIELNREEFFGEGIVFLKNKIYQLTYKNQICFVYDAKTFKKLQQFSYSNKEGWGLTTDGKYIIMSDGSYQLSFIEPTDFRTVKTLQVSANNYAVNHLNELEYIKGYIYANIWPTNIIMKINPADGNVVGKLDLTLLKEDALSKNLQSFETNGIAYDSTDDKIYVTGKMWPRIYQINFPH